MGEYKKIKFGLKIQASNNMEKYEAKQMLLAIQAFTELTRHFKMSAESACKGSLLLENETSEWCSGKITTGHANSWVYTENRCGVIPFEFLWVSR